MPRIYTEVCRHNRADLQKVWYTTVPENPLLWHTKCQNDDSSPMCPAKLVADWLSSVACGPLAYAPVIFKGNKGSSQIRPVEGSDFLQRISRERKVVGRCRFHRWSPRLAAFTYTPP